MGTMYTNPSKGTHFLTAESRRRRPHPFGLVPACSKKEKLKSSQKPATAGAPQGLLEGLKNDLR